MKWTGILGAIFVAVLAFAILVPGSSPATSSVTRYCGKVGGVPIHSHKLACRTARRIYKADMAGNLPPGWACSASLARCYRGEVGSTHYMWWHSWHSPARK